MAEATPPPCPVPPAGEASLAATVDRLVALVREQEAQIAALKALIETLL
ncbi:MAG: hypothetical protein ACRYF2_15845 [Janthinobacterium lividum]